MTDLELLTKINDLYMSFDKEQFEKYGLENKYHNHEHVCDFQIIQALHPISYPKKWAKKQCKKYLKKFGMKGKGYWCESCDSCVHLRYMPISDDNFILGILGPSKDNEFVKKEMLDELR